ncbi:MAG: indolepyruvate oxidoreductase subunit beta [Candidatus Bathyarchaeia archaeon]
MKVKEFNIIIAGVGGQGSVLASRMIADAAIMEGYKVRVGETFGAAQRGGAVASHIRIGTKVYGPLVPEDGLNALIGLEPLEALRVSVKYLSPKAVAIVNTRKWFPVDVNVGRAKYPSLEEIEDSLKKLCNKVIMIDATKIAEEAGSARSLNVVMLGNLAAIVELPFSIESLKKAIKERVPKGTEELNLKAFELGYEALKKE